MDEWQTEHCPVCHKPIGSGGVVDQKTIEKYGDQIYKPGEDLDEVTSSMEEEDRRAELTEFLRQTHEHSNGFQVINKPEEVE